MTSRIPSPEERAALLRDLEGLRPEISVPVLTVAEIVALLEAVDRLDALERVADIANGMDLKCLVYGDQDADCLAVAADVEEPFLPDPLCDNCELYAALRALAPSASVSEPAAPYDESVEPITGCSGRYNCTAATHIEGCLHNVIPPGEPDETPEGDPLGVTLGFEDVGTRSAAEHEALAAGAGVSEPTEGPR